MVIGIFRDDVVLPEPVDLVFFGVEKLAPRDCAGLGAFEESFVRLDGGADLFVGGDVVGEGGACDGVGHYRAWKRRSCHVLFLWGLYKEESRGL